MVDHVVAGEILFDVGVVIVAATAMALVARFLRQPMLAGYIIAGIVIGPQVLGVVENHAIIQFFAELGIAFLLFIVGLELDISRLREVRSVVVGTAAAEILLLFGSGFWLMYFLGFDAISAIYIGLFLAFSSTAVLVKLLLDSGDLDTLHGRIILGILLIQDITVVLVLSILATLNNPGFSALISSVLKGAGMLALAVVLSKYVAGSFFRLIDDSHELVFLTSLTVLFGFIGLSFESGLSTAVGGFLAGVSLTAFPYNIEIAERARTMRDFFVTMFFVSLGMLVSLESVYAHRTAFLLLLGLVLLLKPLIVNLMVSLFRYGKRTSFYTGINLAQISEFSMVIALTGLTLGHIGQDVFSLATALMVVSMSTTPYVLKYQTVLYERIESFMWTFKGARYEEEDTEVDDHVVVCGAHIKGGKILRLLQESGEETVVIDYDPEVIRSWQEEDVTPIYGNIEDAQVLERASVSQAKSVVSTVPDEDDNHFLLNYMQHHNPEATVILSADNIESALLLYEEGADYVLYPKMLAAQEAADLVAALYTDGKSMEEARTEHITELEEEFEESLLKRVEPAFVKRLKDRVKERG